MYTERALRFGSSSIVGAERSSSFRLKVSTSSLSTSGRPEPLFDSRQFSSYESNSAKGGNKNGELFGDNGYLYARKFDTNSLNLNLRAKEQTDIGSKNPTSRNESAGQKMSGSFASPSSRASRRGPATPEALQDRLGIHENFAKVPGPDISLITQYEERMQRLQALATLRQGKVLGDSRVYRQTFVIRSYEVGADGRTSIDTIVSLFQEVAINHFSVQGLGGNGFGATPNMNRYRLIWVITRLHVEVERYPVWPEAVDIDSWTGNAGKNGMRIDWLVRQHGTGEIIAKGTSTWAMMNQDTRRLSKLPEDVRAEIETTFKNSPVAESALRRIPKLDNTARHIKSNLNPRRTDLDGNNHVNNVTYVRWAIESLPAETSDTHDISSLTLEYRRECNKDSVVESLTDIAQDMEETREEIGDNSPATSFFTPVSTLVQNYAYSNIFKAMHIFPENGSLSLTSSDSLVAFCPRLHYTHLLRMQGGKGEEIVRGRTVWKRRMISP